MSGGMDVALGLRQGSRAENGGGDVHRQKRSREGVKEAA